MIQPPAVYRYIHLSRFFPLVKSKKIPLHTPEKYTQETQLEPNFIDLGSFWVLFAVLLPVASWFIFLDKTHSKDLFFQQGASCRNPQPAKLQAWENQGLPVKRRKSIRAKVRGNGERDWFFARSCWFTVTWGSAKLHVSLFTCVSVSAFVYCIYGCRNMLNFSNWMFWKKKRPNSSPKNKTRSTCQRVLM